VLSQKAREISTRLGYQERPVDNAAGFLGDVAAVLTAQPGYNV